MSEIEKMYENAGVKLSCCKYAEYGYEGEEGTWYYCTKENKECWTYPNGNANCVEKGYPPFTAEKQLELIKWLARKGLIQINYSSHQCYQFNSFRVGGDYKTDISEALASHCNNLWQDLTPEEKQQVKGILE